MLTQILLAVALAPSAIRLNATEAALEGPRLDGQFATGFTKGTDRIVWRVKAKPGIYDAHIGFRTPGGPKGYELSINGAKSSGMFPATAELKVQPAGKVELKAENEVAIGGGWSYYDIAYVEFSPAGKPTPIRSVPKQLVDPQASASTRKLFARMVDLYGKKTLSGQFGFEDNLAVWKMTGKTPAILGGDLIDYSPSRVAFGTKPPRLTEQYIEWAKKGQILTLTWHWNAPKDLIDRKEGNKDLSWYRGFYTEATTFDIERALASKDSEDYKLILRDIDAIAVELAKLQKADVPVLWRPLHEAEGGWFWWGAKGPEPCKKLWRLLQDRLTNHHGLHNLIWVWNSSAPAWYPGDDAVDIMSIDAYPSDRTDPLSVQWEDLLARLNGKKMLALAEFPGPPDVEKMRRFGVRWSHFVSWTGDLGPKGSPKALVERTYRSPLVVNGR